MDDGQVLLDSTEVSHAPPLEARRAGFRLVRQEPVLVPDITVAENVLIGEYPRGAFGRVDFAAMRAEAQARLDRYGFTGMVLPEATGRRPSPAQTHLVEILRALQSGVKVVAFDEPTSSLISDEVERLFILIRRLRGEGLGVIYVSHRQKEVTAISDRIVVLKDGGQTGNMANAETDDGHIVRLMVGRVLVHDFRRAETTRSEVVLDVQGLFSRWHRDISFRIHAGEILGFGWLVGACRTELAKVIFGEFPKTAGTVRMSGVETDIRDPSDAIAASIGLAPENRKVEGLILVRSVIENAALAVYPRLSRMGFLRTDTMVEAVGPVIRQLEVKPPA